MNNTKVTNAIIMSAGFSSRFTPLSDVCPKALLPVKGEILIERQIRQLKEAGIPDIYIVIGHKKESYYYLEKKMGVHLIENTEYETRNNNSSVYAARHILGNSYLCSSDNYFTENVFADHEEHAYYASLYASGSTNEYCLTTDQSGRICKVTVGGFKSWYMCGHVYLNESFTEKFLHYLEAEYELPETQALYWEHIYMNHLDTLDLYIKKYAAGVIQEFDDLSELQQFDSYYLEHSVEDIISTLMKC